MKVFDIINESIEGGEKITRSAYTVQDAGSGSFKISVNATKGPLLTPMLGIAYALKAAGAEIKSKSGLPIKFSTFKSNTLIVKNVDLDTINTIVDDKVKEHIAYHDERRERAKPENVAARKKEYNRISSVSAKKRKDELETKFGADIVGRVKIKSMSREGDDGYQWSLFVDGHRVKRGMTQTQAYGEQKKTWAWLKKVKEDPEQAQRDIELGRGIAAYFEYERMQKEIKHYLGAINKNAKGFVDAINKAKK